MSEIMFQVYKDIVTKAFLKGCKTFSENRK